MLFRQIGQPSRLCDILGVELSVLDLANLCCCDVGTVVNWRVANESRLMRRLAGPCGVRGVNPIDPIWLMPFNALYMAITVVWVKTRGKASHTGLARTLVKSRTHA